MRIIGIDPGSRVCGYGVVEVDGPRSVCIAAGPIHLKGEELPTRLAQLHRVIVSLLEVHQPEVAAIEKVFLARNPDSALKLGHARGAALAALAGHDLPITEYSARSIKQAVAGSGGADKIQIQHMVSVLLKLEKKPQADAADALAVALCHAHHQQSLLQLGGAVPTGRNAWRSAGSRRRGGRMWRLPDGG